MRRIHANLRCFGLLVLVMISASFSFASSITCSFQGLIVLRGVKFRRKATYGTCVVLRCYLINPFRSQHQHLLSFGAQFNTQDEKQHKPTEQSRARHFDTKLSNTLNASLLISKAILELSIDPKMIKTNMNTN